MNKKELTKKESELSDLFLEELITVTDKDWVHKNFTYGFFKKFNVNQNRCLLICDILEKRNLIKLNIRENDRLFTIRFEKAKTREFLNNGGMTELWLKRNKLLYDFRMSKIKVISFPWFFTISVLSGVFSIIKIVDYISSESKEKKVDEAKSLKEAVKEKSITLVFPKKKY